MQKRSSLSLELDRFVELCKPVEACGSDWSGSAACLGATTVAASADCKPAGTSLQARIKAEAASVEGDPQTGDALCVLSSDQAPGKSSHCCKRRPLAADDSSWRGVERADVCDMRRLLRGQAHRL